MTMVIDLRCLQDTQYAERGIGNHARALLRHAPPGWVGLYDPRLPPLPEAVARQAARLSPHAYVPGARRFLNPSPFSPDQNFCARLLTDTGVRKAACVYDFIPFDEPERYLGDPVARLDYLAALAWLRRYDVFLPISQPTLARLRELFGAVEAAVTGVGLPPFLEALPPAAPRHILMVGGDDPRKNPETLLRAHASSPALREIPLVITGAYGPQAAARLRALSPVTLPGRVSDAEMAALYAGALAVVTPSRAEGFSLPVMEACKAGAPSLASDIPAHRALLPGRFLFGVDDAPALARLLEETLARRAEVVAAQADLAAPFTEAAVASRVFAALEQGVPPRPVSPPRLAMLTPLPPARSGVADHSAALLAALRGLGRVDVFAPPLLSPLPLLEGAYDAALCVIGNSPLHKSIHDLCLRHGAGALCHDSRLLGLATAAGLEPAAAQASAELGRAVSAAEVARWAADESRREASFLGPLARAARPLIFHAPQPAALCRARFGAEAAFLPFPMMRPYPPVTGAERAAARARLGIAPEERLVVSLGFLVPGKGIAEALGAFARVKARLPRARLVFAGAAEMNLAPFAAEAKALGVTLGTGYLPAAEYRAWMAAADAGLQLRLGQPGGISAALQDLIGAGLPCAASRDLAENIAAPAYVRRVSDWPDIGEIAGALLDCLSGAEEREAARTAYIEAHSMAGYARRLLSLLLESGPAMPRPAG
ncbi:glycosyltransferase [Acidocella sp.]|uniref:glycosyltransferase n=1 Tax=Acidocella sp. TaxID=50710 RepID=UPI0026315AE9|nr:glycosyltransferase [Acidocella sp.]